MNGILFVLSQIARWLMTGGSLIYDATFATDPNIGGYPAARCCCAATVAASG